MNQGTRRVLLMQKNRRRKSHAWAPLKGDRAFIEDVFEVNYKLERFWCDVFYDF